jgi:hypothetical protein
MVKQLMHVHFCNKQLRGFFGRNKVKLKGRHLISSLLSVRAVETNHVGEVFAGTADDISNFLGSWSYVHIGTVGKQASLKKSFGVRLVKVRPENILFKNICLPLGFLYLLSKPTANFQDNCHILGLNNVVFGLKAYLSFHRNVEKYER